MAQRICRIGFRRISTFRDGRTPGHADHVVVFAGGWQRALPADDRSGRYTVSALQPAGAGYGGESAFHPAPDRRDGRVDQVRGAVAVCLPAVVNHPKRPEWYLSNFAVIDPGVFGRGFLDGWMEAGGLGPRCTGSGGLDESRRVPCSMIEGRTKSRENAGRRPGRDQKIQTLARRETIATTVTTW